MKLLESDRSSRTEKCYNAIAGLTGITIEIVRPYLRRFIRFIALPYAYMAIIDWGRCDASKMKTIYDLIYIFFNYKYFPDNYYVCRFWEKDKEEWPYYYGSTYDPYQRRQFQKKIYDKKNYVLFDNKQICYQLCLAAGFPLPNQFDMLVPTDDYKTKIKEITDKYGLNKLIIKPYDGHGGKGIVVCNKTDNILTIKRKEQVCPLDEFDLDYPAVIQEFVRQHPLLESYSSSTNTIRVVTLYTNDSNVIIVGAFMRFGLGMSDVDNLSSGGIAVGVDVASGELYEQAVGFDGRDYTAHPSSGKEFKGFAIPFWDDVVKLSESVQKQFSFHKMLGLDVCITADGPLILEINSDNDMVALEMTYGPILKRREVWEQFKNYNLLINSPSKRLHL